MVLRCSGEKLGGSVSVHLSPTDSDPQGPPEDLERIVNSHSDSTKLAQTVTVPSCNKSVDRKTDRVTKVSKVVDTAQVEGRTSIPRNVGPDCMEIIEQQCIKKKKISPIPLLLE